MTKKRQLPFKVAVQHIERVIITGPPDRVGDAFDWAQSRGFILSQVGPRLIGAELVQSDQQRFVLLAERVVK